MSRAFRFANAVAFARSAGRSWRVWCWLFLAWVLFLGTWLVAAAAPSWEIAITFGGSLPCALLLMWLNRDQAGGS